MAARGRRYVVYPDDAAHPGQRKEVVHGVGRGRERRGPRCVPPLVAMLAYMPAAADDH
ncbi:hypothetical protein DSC45_34350 [Streptomyces sp. YIM 130001]|uniref:hypothetical protein n=1 Tax=Streptomyces sp. YIM 130001 TaxID=2259644 RepID=UPI000EC6066B|nr:hypothetical protein [Streptomyces sp. YIM 130001]RII07909.1 hypothetical protein DSC45_34350 [Streptomyces sp. YIM 130001]